MQKYVHIVDLVKSFLTVISYLVSTCKNRLRYSRERSSQNFEVIQFVFSIHSLGREDDDAGGLRHGHQVEALSGRTSDPAVADKIGSVRHSNGLVASKVIHRSSVTRALLCEIL